MQSRQLDWKNFGSVLALFFEALVSDSSLQLPRLFFYQCDRLTITYPMFNLEVTSSLKMHCIPTHNSLSLQVYKEVGERGLGEKAATQALQRAKKKG